MPNAKALLPVANSIRAVE